MTLQTIPIEKIRPDPNNVRVWGANKAADAQLLASVRALGLLQPLLVVPYRELPDGFNGFQIVAGHRRFAAARAANLAAVPCQVRDGIGQGEFTSLAKLKDAIIKTKADGTGVVPLLPSHLRELACDPAARLSGSWQHNAINDDDEDLADEGALDDESDAEAA